MEWGKKEGTGCKFDKNPFYCRSFPDRVSISVRTAAATTLVEAPKIRAMPVKKSVDYRIGGGKCINEEIGAVVLEL